MKATMPDRRASLLAGHSFFRSLSEDQLAELSGLTHERDFSRGQMIFQKGDTGDSLIAVLSRRVKIGTVSSDGKEVVFNIINAGEIFGEIALLDGGVRTADATPLEKSHLLILHRSDFIRFFERHSSFAVSLMEVLCERIRRTTELVEDSIFLDVAARIARRLMYLSREQHHAGGDQPIQLKISQQELGDFAGISRETTNRVLNQWRESGVIDLGYGALTINDRDAIEQLAREGDDAAP